MEATLQFYCGILGMRLVRTTRTPDGRRHYNVEIGGGNAFAVFDGAKLPTAGERQHVNHLALPVDTLEEFDAAYQRLKDHGVAVTEIIERGYGKTFYFHDPNGIRLQIELKTKQDADSWKAIPTLSRTCAHCCSGLSAAHGSADQRRILVGPDAHKIDELVRRSPGRAYDVDFFEHFAREVGWPCLPDIAPTLLSPTGPPAER
jgi:catechol 2,3-dioxygenase-like lactoylglutathione lyase family enzyme